MKRIVLIILILGCQGIKAQTGINILEPKVNLHVVADLENQDNTEGIIAPILSGNRLKAMDDLYTLDQTGTIVYIDSAVNNPSPKTIRVKNPGYYFFDGEIWKEFEADILVENDATRTLGGTIYARFLENADNSTAFNDLIVGDSPGGNYQIGTLSLAPKRGSIVSIRGQGYKISNPQDGIFDIKFDVPYKEIYGISGDLLDGYGNAPFGGLPPGKNPVLSEPGNALNTTDNVQVAFVSNSYIRIITGNQHGQKSNRPFSFLVTGK